MSWAVVARKDFVDSIRARSLWAVSTLFVLFTAGIAYLYAVVVGAASDGSLASIDLVVFLMTPAALLVPLTGLMLGHKSLAGERESGSVKLLLSLPHSRRDAVLGKIAGRGAVLGLAILLGFAVAAVIVAALYDSFAVADYLWFVALTLVLGFTYTSIGVSLSTLTGSQTRATVYAAGFFVVFEVLWDMVPTGLYYAATGNLAPSRGPGQVASYPDWYWFVSWLSPSNAWSGTLNGVLPGEFQFASQYPDGIPFYLTEWAALAILLGWLVASAALGYLSFRSGDL